MAHVRAAAILGLRDADLVSDPPTLARTWWRAIDRATWSTAVQWREAFVRFAAQDGLVTRDYVDGFLGEVATLPRLVELVEDPYTHHCAT